ncbi:uncharacterized protein LOC125673117 [Ostrea edulis]|uniref:uncharacterized protein LOC125673117 n=1 Tax=Ostrea edulis TaxID=37623 RepID=UPI0024AF5DAD|nr:uncharacterized protein LOC125673117 [Ostrea edulis]
MFNKSKTFVHHLMKTDQYKKIVVQVICKEIRKEISEICRKEDNQLHYNTEIKDWKSLLQYFNQRAPITASLLKSVISKDVKESEIEGHKLISLCTGFSVLLYSRNNTLSRLQYTIGLILDQCGATKEAISVLHDLGISVSPSALHRKKRDIVRQQEEIVQETVGKYVSERRDAMTATKLIREYEDQMSEMNVLFKPKTQPVLFEKFDMPRTPRVLSNGCGVQLDTLTTRELWDCSKRSTSNTSADSEVTFSMNYHSQMRGVTQEPVTVQFNASANQNSNPGIIYSSGNQGKVVSFLKEKIRKTKENPSPPIEILGDNIDILVSPANMTLDRQRKSWHWFLLLATQKRITDKDLPTDESLADVETIDSCEFVPSEDEIEEYQKNTQFHVAKILTKYIEELRQFERLLPNNIQHPYIEKTSQKSVFINCDLIDESENSSDGMIRILQRVHSLAVPHINENIEKVVLGGDVLTNERALSAQQAMRNNETCDEKLLGVIHRPEGLHRQMNFLMVTFHHWNLLFLVYFILRAYIKSFTKRKAVVMVAVFISFVT